MRIRWGLIAPVLSCVVVLAAYETTTTSARAVPSRIPGGQGSSATAGAKELAPGEFRFTTGLDKIPQHVRGPVTCDTRDGIYRIAIGDQDAGGVELGLSEDESVLKYAALGYRNGVSFTLLNNGNTGGVRTTALPSVQKTGSTYFASGYATGSTATHRDTGLYFEISVACP